MLRHWQGLGYPRRARNLHDAARLIVERHGGDVPDTIDALRALPGVGPYTARAVLAFAFERDVAVVDTNIARVLARVDRRAAHAATRPGGRRRTGAAGCGWVWNQVLMDLGATVCRPAPRCDECPLATSCAWHVAGRPAPDPATARRASARARLPTTAATARRAATCCGRCTTVPAAPMPSRPASSTVSLADRLVARTGELLHLP